jgi:hypothetical protein
MTDEEYAQAVAAERERFKKLEDAAHGRRRAIEASLSGARDSNWRHAKERELEQVDAELTELDRRIRACRVGRVRYTRGDPTDMLEPRGRNQLICEAGRRGLADGV